MPRQLTTADLEPSPEWGRMLLRGLVRRCPRCGSGGLFKHYWTIRDRCPRCGLRFIREEGYFTGVYLLNFAVVLVALFVLMMVFAVLRGSNTDGPLTGFIVVGVVIAIALPILSYPFARTTWAALDLIMTPLELEEILDSAEASDEPQDADDQDPDDQDPDDQDPDDQDPDDQDPDGPPPAAADG